MPGGRSPARCPGATFDIATDANITSFNNFSIALVNEGTISGAGTVGVLGVGTFGVSTTVTVEGAWAPGATVLHHAFGVGNPTLLIGAGADATTGSVTHDGGTIGGAGTLTVTGVYTWTRGAQGGTGLTVVQGGLAVSGSDSKTFTGDLE